MTFSNASLATALIAVTAMFLPCTTAFTAMPNIIVGRNLDSFSTTQLFYKTSILERPFKAPKKKKRTIKSKAVTRSFVEENPVSVESLVVSLNDPQVRHKVHRRPRKIADVDRERRQRNAMLSFEEGQELARLAVQEVLKEYNIDDVVV